MTTAELVMGIIILALGVVAGVLYRRGRQNRNVTLVYVAVALWVLEAQARAARARGSVARDSDG